jgi:hypothetical protein
LDEGERRDYGLTWNPKLILANGCSKINGLKMPTGELGGSLGSA